VIVAGNQDLVVREGLLRPLLESRLGVVWDVRGIAGAGKSLLLRDLQRRVSQEDGVVLVDLQDYFTTLGPGESAADRFGGPGGELRRFGRVLSTVMEGLRYTTPKMRGAIEDILNAIGRTVQEAGKLGQAEADELASQLVDRLRDEINQMIVARTEAGGRVYVLVDAFELVIDRPVGRWLLWLLDGLDGSVAAVARRVDDSESAALPTAVGLAEFGELDMLEVGEMTAGEVRDYLTRRIGAPGGEIAAAVHGFTGGHALEVGLTGDLVADMIADMRRRGQPVTTDGRVKELIEQMEPGRDDPPDVRLSRLVTRFIEGNNPDPAVAAADGDSAIGRGLDCLWVVRRFDFPLLRSLLAAGGESAGGARLAERLISYSFVEQRTPLGRPGEQYYVVHDRVRQQGLQQFVDRVRRDELLRVAQDYYQDEATKTLDSYERWFRYEDTSWQTIAREWLYYAAQLEGADQESSRLGIAVLFVDAFWWWGNYIAYPFCEELLADWTEMAESRRHTIDLDWGNWLREVYLRYPKGWRRQATSGDWRALRQRLLVFLRERKELRDETKERVRHVRGLLYIYLAEAERFLDPHSRRVEQNLSVARELFAADDDEWDVAWVSFQQADAALGRGDAQAAVAAADIGWRDLTEEMEDDDFELAANLHRVHADAAWLRGERGLALDLYARAALSAYKVQVDVGDTEDAPIDEYTQAFMTEMHERVAERLSALHEAGEDATVREACARIRRFFDPYWRAAGEAGLVDPAEAASLLAQGRAGEVVAGLFPPSPAPADLHQVDTQYALTAVEVTYDMEDELAEPPGTALPSAVA
jgi:hypothetical protein